jgi:hypothetical protein
VKQLCLFVIEINYVSIGIKKKCQFILESKTIKAELKPVQMLSFFFENSNFLKENFQKIIECVCDYVI